MMTEQDIVAAADAWLAGQGGFEIFHEVEMAGTRMRADMVATTENDDVIVFEGKLQLSWPLLTQARRWKHYANAVWIVVPGSTEPPDAARQLSWEVANRFLKLGVLEIVNGDAWVREPAPIISRSSDALKRSLREEHKTWARGGSPSGGQYTPHQAWLRRLADFVDANPACTAEEAAQHTEHPFRTMDGAVRYIEKHAKAEEIPNVFVGWRQRLFSTKEAARRGQ